MPTIKLPGPDGSLFLIPEWTLEHAGISGAQAGHADLKNASGSVFLPDADPMALFKAFAAGGASISAVGVGFQMEAPAPVGWCSITDNSTGQAAPTGFIMKQEAPAGSKVASSILALAFADPAFGEPSTLTRQASAIAPPTIDARFLPDDCAADAEVLSAMAAGKLRTFVSVFPGPFEIGGTPIPRASQMGSDILFRVHPENANFIACKGSPEAMEAFVREYNAQALKDNKPSDLAADLASAKARSVGLGIAAWRQSNAPAAASPTPSAARPS